MRVCSDAEEAAAQQSAVCHVGGVMCTSPMRAYVDVAVSLTLRDANILKNTHETALISETAIF